MQELHATYRTHPARACWGKSDRVLPALQTLFLEGPLPSGPVQEAIEHFIAARQLSARPVFLSHLESKRNMWDWVNSFA